MLRSVTWPAYLRVISDNQKAVPSVHAVPDPNDGEVHIAQNAGLGQALPKPPAGLFSTLIAVGFPYTKYPLDPYTVRTTPVSGNAITKASWMCGGLLMN